MRRAVSSRLATFAHETAAVSAIEFALWTPFLLILLLGGVDITRYEIATGRLSDAANTIGQMLAVNTSGSVNYVDLQFYHDASLVAFPQVLADAAARGITWSQNIAITMSSVAFVAQPQNCTGNCTYKPKLVWTSGDNKRSCATTMTSASDTSAPGSGTLPADAFGPNTIFVVDIAYNFRPLFASAILGNRTILRSYFVSPRYVPAVAFQAVSGDPGTTTVCP